MPSPTCSAASACAQVFYAILRKDTKVTWCRTPPPRWSHARGSVPCISVCDNVEPCDSATQGSLFYFWKKKKENIHTDANTRGLILTNKRREREIERSIMNVLQRLIDLEINRVCINASIQTLLNYSRSLLHILSTTTFYQDNCVTYFIYDILPL